MDITVNLEDVHHKVTATYTHTVDPKDILIRERGVKNVTPYVTLQQAADTNRCIHIAYVAEGYQKGEMGKFIEDAKIAMESLFSYEPFKSMCNRFNLVAVMSESEESGVSKPGKGIWINNLFGTHYDTFYSPRYSTTSWLKSLNNALAGTPYEHIIMLVNDTTYGGGGTYNSFTLADTHHPLYKTIVVHEFGHGFGGLGDEYAYDDSHMNVYPSDTEPWEPNLTTLHNFHGKWENLIKKGTPIPTLESNDPKVIPNRVGVFEGAGFQKKEVYRGVQDCRMKTNTASVFCPVCKQALTRLIDFYTK